VRVGISANPNKPLALKLAERAIRRIGDRAVVVLTPETGAALGGGRASAALATLDADLLFVLGGDGTILYTLQHTGLPILAVNAGTVGFLAEIDGTEGPGFDGAIERVLAGSYYIEDRMRLAGSIAGRRVPDATNEIVVHTGQVAKMRVFEILVDRRPVGTVRADGMILATPTGSTSYSLSNQGPIVDPWIEGILVTALAPFQAMPRAVLVNPLRTVGVRLVDPGKEGVVVVDGQREFPIAGGETLTVYRSARRSSFVRLGGGFFRQLLGKHILPWAPPTAAPPPVNADLSPPP
jgi:NAD+ kinase